MTLVLASSSPIRRAMLVNAGVEHIAIPASIDEAAYKADGSDPRAISLALGAAKAVAVSRQRPADWTIGSDSIVSVGGRLFDKPADRDEAAAHLRFFSNQAMTLTSAVALAKDGRTDWTTVDQAMLHVRSLSEEFISAYLDREWPAVSYCVGVFRLEGPGVQLFDRIEGDHFTILGLPLIPLLGALRERGLLLQ